MLTLFPGPDLLYVFSTSLIHGKKNGIKVSLGLTTGLWIHTLLVIIGMGNLLKSYPESQRIIEVIGGIYLLYLAFMSLRSSSKKENEKPFTSSNIKSRYFLTGFIMNLTSPKVSLFSLSFFPGFIFHQSLPYSYQFLILGGLFFIQALIIFSAVALFADAFSNKLQVQKQNKKWDKIQSLLLAIIALLLLYP